MDQHIFIEDNERIHTFIQLTYTALSSTGAVPLKRLEDSYRAMEPMIHRGASGTEPDCGALSYAALRLPACLRKVRRVFLGQSESILEESGVPMSAWTEVLARARRRRYLYDGRETLICLIASKSDVDDIIPCLLAFQIEWNKLHAILASRGLPAGFAAGLPGREPETGAQADRNRHLARLFGIPDGDAAKLADLFSDDLPGALEELRDHPMDLYIRNFEASYCRYRRETETWWRQIQDACPGIEERPVYFVSSNTHSLINLLSGYAESRRDEILAVDDELAALARSSGADGSALLYYLLMKYEQQDPDGRKSARRHDHETRVGVRRIAAEKTLDIPTQVVDLKILAESPNAGAYATRFASLAGTDAMILNIDYPLGRTAYFILNKLAEHCARIMGVYVIGKAASLFADRGDIMIPSSIVDQHTRNRYFFENCIKAKNLQPYIDAETHAIYDNQRAVTVLGTFLQNKRMLDGFLTAGITDLEMEAGPYLAAMYEIARPKRYPENETISLLAPGTDLGIVHYVSDNPLAGRNLDRRLELDGVDATYASTRAVLDRILEREAEARSGQASRAHRGVE